MKKVSAYPVTIISHKRITKPHNYWLSIVHEDETVSNQHLYCKWDAVFNKAKMIVATTNPPIDVVFILDGRAEPDNPKPEHILQRLEPRPFTDGGIPCVDATPQQLGLRKLPPV